MNDSAAKLNPLFRQEFFFWCCAVVSLVALLGNHSLFWVEPRIAEAAREAVLTKRWYPLTINFREVSGLPLLEVWSVALAFKFGVSEFAARLPSALAALALLIGIRRLALRLFDRGTALLAGWLTLGSCGVLFTGRCCGSGIFSGAVVLWALAVYLHGVGKRSFWHTLIVCLLLSLGALDRGARFLWLAAAILAPWLYADRSRPDRKCLRVAAAVILAAGVYLAAFRIFGDPVLDRVKRWWNLAAAAGPWEVVKHWAVVWWSRRKSPVYAGFYEVPRVMLPWSLISLTAFVGALCRLRRQTRADKCLLAGVAAGFVALAFPASSCWQDFLPLVPLLALETGLAVLRGDGGRWDKRAVVVTRSLIVVLAAFGVVSPITIPVWRQLTGGELPVLFWGACVFFGAAVLFVMMLDSYPTRPLSHLTGLPDPLGSTIIGGTLTTICLISFLLPTLRELKGEKPFVTAIKADVAGLPPRSVVSVGGNQSVSVLLFYGGFSEAISAISVRDGEKAEAKFVRLISDNPGSRFAVISRRRKRDLAVLRRWAEAAKLDIDLEKPTREENVSPGFDSGRRRRACWLITPPAAAAEKPEKINP